MTEAEFVEKLSDLLEEFGVDQASALVVRRHGMWAMYSPIEDGRDLVERFLVSTQGRDPQCRQ